MSTIRKIAITDCSRGLGRARVNEFVAAGHQVAGCSRSTSHRRDIANPSRYVRYRAAILVRSGLKMVTIPVLQMVSALLVILARTQFD